MGHIILVVNTAASPTAGDLILQGRIEAAGHTVTRQSDEAGEFSGAYDGVVIADSSGGATVGSKYDTVAKPGLTCENVTWRLGTYLSGIAGNTNWTVESVTGNGGLTGDQVIYDAAQSQQGIDTDTLPGGATVVARATGDADQGTYVVYESGGALTDGTAPARRAFFRVGDGALDNLTSAGLTLLDAAISWTFGAPAVTGVATITLGALGVTVAAGPQTKTGTAAVTPGGLSVTATGLRTTAGTASVTLGALSVLASNAVVTGTAAVTLGALSVAASGTVILPPPGDIFDLSRVHLTLPTEDPGPDTDAEQIDQPELDTYSGPHFSLTSAHRIRFVAPVVGATTSGASGSTRSELREHEAGSYANTAFNPNTTGRRQVTITTRVDASNITGGSNPRREAIGYQIHGAADSPIPLIIAFEYHVATPRVRIFKNGPGVANPVVGITPTTDITIRCRVENATVRLWVIAGQKEDLPSIADPAPYEWPVSDFTDQSGWYFKPGGIYNKTTIASGSSGESVAEVSWIEILQPGDPDPEGTVSGTANLALGALSVQAFGTRVATGPAAITLGAVSVVATGTRVVQGSATVAPGALQVSAAGTVIAEVVTGSVALPLGALSVAATGQRTTFGEAAAILGGLVVTAQGPITVTGAAVVSLGEVSVTAVGAVVAEVVSGAATIAPAGLVITAVGSRATSGLAAVTLPSLLLTAVGTLVRTAIRAGDPVVVAGPIAGAPTRAGPVAGEPTVIRSPVASTPVVR